MGFKTSKAFSPLGVEGELTSDPPFDVSREFKFAPFAHEGL